MLQSAKAVLRPLYYATGAAAVVHGWRRRRARFDAERVAYFARHATAGNRDYADADLAEFVAKGFVVLRDIHDPTLVKALHDRLFDIMERVRRGEKRAGWEIISDPDDGIYRLRHVERLLPETRELLDNGRAAALVRGYIGGEFRTAESYVDYKPDVVHDYTTIPHFDSWKSQVKIFTLLNDVTDANAPFVYWTGTHHDRDWRRQFDYARWSGDYAGSAGLVPPHILRDLIAAGGPGATRETTIMGPAGTAIIADTRGVHRASNLRDGYRLQIVQKFNV